MLRTFILLLFASLVTSCGMSAEEIKQAQAERRAAQIAYVTPICESYGFVKGTQAMAACVQSEINQRLEQQRRAWQAVSDAGRAMQSYGKDDDNESMIKRDNVSCRQRGQYLECHRW